MWPLDRRLITETDYEDDNFLLSTVGLFEDKSKLIRSNKSGRHDTEKSEFYSGKDFDLFICSKGHGNIYIE